VFYLVSNEKINTDENKGDYFTLKIGFRTARGDLKKSQSSLHRERKRMRRESVRIEKIFWKMSADKNSVKRSEKTEEMNLLISKCLLRSRQKERTLSTNMF